MARFAYYSKEDENVRTMNINYLLYKLDCEGKVGNGFAIIPGLRR